MKRYIKLSLLLLLIPLFVKNVYAEELIDLEPTEQYQIELQENVDIPTYEETPNTNEPTLEDVLNQINKEYNLDLDEIDNVKYESASGKSKTIEKLTELINIELSNNNYNLNELGYKYELRWNYFETGNTNSYTMIIKDLEGNNIRTIDLNVTYRNTYLRSEEKASKVNNFVENRRISEIKEFTIDEVFSALKENRELISSLEEYLRGIFNAEGIDFLILNNENTNNKITSNYKTGTVLLTIDGIIYKVIRVEYGYVTKFDVPSEEDEKSYIENYMRDKITEYEYLTNIENIRYDEANKEIFALVNSTDSSLGNIRVNKIRKAYGFLEGENSNITTGNSLTIIINGDRNELKRVEINSVEVNPIYYILSENNTKITINNEFIKSLNIGTYRLDVVFKYGRALTTFTISEKKNQNTGNNQGQNNNNNNNNNNSVPPSQSTGGNNYYRPTYGNSNNDYDDDDDEREDGIVNEEEQEENKEDTAIKQENDINLKEVLDVDKDNDEDDVDFEDDEENTKKKTSMVDKIKSRYVPIIIVVVAILIGGTAAFLYLKAKEEDVRF